MSHTQLHRISFAPLSADPADAPSHFHVQVAPQTPPPSQPDDPLVEQREPETEGWPGNLFDSNCAQVGNWLRSLELAEFVEKFAVEGVDGAQLRHVDDKVLLARFGMTDQEEREAVVTLLQLAHTREGLPK